MSIPTLTEKIGGDATFIRGCCGTTVKLLCESIPQFFPTIIVLTPDKGKYDWRCTIVDEISPWKKCLPRLRVCLGYDSYE